MLNKELKQQLSSLVSSLPVKDLFWFENMVKDAIQNQLVITGDAATIKRAIEMGKNPPVHGEPIASFKGGQVHTIYAKASLVEEHLNQDTVRRVSAKGGFHKGRYWCRCKDIENKFYIAK